MKVYVHSSLCIKEDTEMLRVDPSLNLDSVHCGYPFQIDAVEAIKDLEYAAVFHEQGLGKTKIAIDLALYWLSERIVDCVLVLTKLHLVDNWRKELKEHTYIAPSVLSQDQNRNFFVFNSAARIVLGHYEVVKAERRRLEVYLRTRRVAVILDEAQKIKNPNAQVTRACHDIRCGFERRIVMTGTPVANRPEDVWSQIYFLDGGKSLGENFGEFRESVALGNTLHEKPEKQRKLTKELGGVFEKIQKFSVRETKDTAGIDLPEKSISVVSSRMEPRQEKIYNAYRNHMNAQIVKECSLVNDRAEEVLKRLLRLVQVASNPMLVDEEYSEIPGKYPQLIRILDNAMNESDKVIVWTSFVKNAKWLRNKLSSYGCACLHGHMEMKERSLSINRFMKDDKTRVLVATPGSAKEGLTLTVANQAIFFDRSFSLDDYLQAQDRIHRITQTKNCKIWNIICKNTVDQWVDELLQAKRLAAQLLQSDISEEGYRRNMSYEYGRLIKEVLQPDNGGHENG